MLEKLSVLVVDGNPATAGSKRALKSASTGRIIVLDDCKRGKAWRQAIQAAARESGIPCRTGPVKLVCNFVLPRPKCHRGADGHLKATAPIDHVTRPDTTKLLRAVEDALNGVAWADDGQVVSQFASKRYAFPNEKPGVRIGIMPGDHQ